MIETLQRRLQYWAQEKERLSGEHYRAAELVRKELEGIIEVIEKDAREAERKSLEHRLAVLRGEDE